MRMNKKQMRIEIERLRNLVLPGPLFIEIVHQGKTYFSTFPQDWSGLQGAPDARGLWPIYQIDDTDLVVRLGLQVQSKEQNAKWEDKKHLHCRSYSCLFNTEISCEAAEVEIDSTGRCTKNKRYAAE